MRTLLLGFEPFRKRKTNPSWEVCLRVANRFSPTDVIIPPSPLPVDFLRAPVNALELVRKTAPDFVLALGLAAGSPAIRLERFALNAYLPDKHTVASIPNVLRQRGPDAIRTRAPLEAVARHLSANDIPVTVSNSPGLFVCNALYYSLLLEARRHRPWMRVLFVHLPLLPRQTARSALSSLPSMSLPLQSRAVVQIIQTVKKVECL